MDLTNWLSSINTRAHTQQTQGYPPISNDDLPFGPLPTRVTDCTRYSCFEQGEKQDRSGTIRHKGQ